jgi:hypothetical protein
MCTIHSLPDWITTEPEAVATIVWKIYSIKKYKHYVAAVTQRKQDQAQYIFTCMAK